MKANLDLQQPDAEQDKLCWRVPARLFSSEGERQTVEERSHDDERGMTKGKREKKEARRQTGVGGQI